MKKKISFLIFVLFSISVLLAGCGNQEAVRSDTPDTSALSESIPPDELESTHPSETEEPEQTKTPEPENSAASSDKPEQELSAPSQETENTESESLEEENSKMKMNVNVNGQDFTATLENNSAVDALVQMMKNGPVTLQLSDYVGFEKVGPLGQSLPASNSQTTTHAGDIVLYQGNQIVMFYGSNSWSYTRLGHIDDLTGWEEALGSGDVTVTLSMED